MSIDRLLDHPALWRAREQDGVARRPVVPTGYAELDECLPGGGWPSRGLVELLADHAGIGELSLLVPALARLCGPRLGGRREEGGGWLAWISPPHQPYAPALAACGIDVDRVLVVRARPAEWAMEQAVRSGACSVVLGWTDCREFAVLRRLQLAAEQSRSLAVLFRRLRHAGESSPAVLRMALECAPGGLDVRVLKSRGGRPARVHLPWTSSIVPLAN